MADHMPLSVKGSLSSVVPAVPARELRDVDNPSRRRTTSAPRLGAELKKVIDLAAELGDDSSDVLTPTGRKLFAAIKNGDTEIKQLKRTLGKSTESIGRILWRVSDDLHYEKGRRDRDVRGVSFEDRPTRDLLKDPTIENRLRESKWKITTGGALVERSEAEVLEINGIGRKAFYKIRDRLWTQWRKTLRQHAHLRQCSAASVMLDATLARQR